MRGNLWVTTLIVLLFLLFNLSASWSQSINRSPLMAGARSEMYSGRRNAVFEVVHNQAALARVVNPSLGLYSERQYLLSGLSRSLAVAVFPVDKGRAGLKWAQSGAEGYRESQVGLSYGLRLSDRMDLGVGFNYSRLQVTGGYGKSGAPSAEAGILLHLTSQVHAGFHCNNPVGGYFAGTGGEKLPAVYSAGISFICSEQLSLSAELIKQENINSEFLASLSYQAVRRVGIRAGWATSMAAAWMTTEVQFGRIALQFSTNYHPQLGLSPALGLVINFPSPNDPGL